MAEQKLYNILKKAKPFTSVLLFCDRILPSPEFQVRERHRFWENVPCGCFLFRAVLLGQGVSCRLLP